MTGSLTSESERIQNIVASSPAAQNLQVKFNQMNEIHKYSFNDFFKSYFIPIVILHIILFIVLYFVMKRKEYLGFVGLFAIALIVGFFLLTSNGAPLLFTYIAAYAFAIVGAFFMYMNVGFNPGVAHATKSAK